MSRETDFSTRLSGDAPLTAILTGGIYAREALGREGLTRETVPAAFDANGYPKPSAVVVQRGKVPDGVVRDDIEQKSSAVQIVEVYVYEETGFSSIDSAMDRIYVLLFGYQFSDSFPLELTNVIDRQRDTGALNGASLARMDWVVYQVREV